MLDLKPIIDIFYLLFLISSLGGGFYVFYVFVSEFKEDKKKSGDVFYNITQKRQLEEILDIVNQIKSDFEEIKKRGYEKEQN